MKALSSKGPINFLIINFELLSIKKVSGTPNAPSSIELIPFGSVIMFV